MRLLGVMIHSTAFTFGVVLAVYIGSLALGAAWSVTPRWRDRNPTRAFLAVQGLVSICAVSAIVLVVRVAGSPGTAQPLWDFWGGVDIPDFSAALAQLPRLVAGHGDAGAWQTLALLAVLYGCLPVVLVAPSALLMGLGFGLAQRAVQTVPGMVGRRFGWLYAANIAGSVAGALVSTFVLLDAIGTANSLRLIAAIGGAYFLPFAWRHSHRRWALAAAVATVLFVVLISPSRQRLWAALHSADPGSMVVKADSSGVFVVREEEDGSAAVAINGVVQSRLPYGGIHTALGALPVLVHDNPERVLIIGLGSGDTAFAAGARPETRDIECVETIAGALPTLRAWQSQFGSASLAGLFGDPRIQHIVGGGRRQLVTSRAGYDIVEADALLPSAPFSGQVYSVEFFDLVRSRLRPGGIAVSWAPTPRTRDSFVKVFPYAVEMGSILMGSDTAIAIDPQTIEARADLPFTRERFERAGVDLDDALGSYIETPPSTFGPDVDRDALVDVNSDYFPRDEFLVP
jgi:spermidine synthase